jgi:catechol 2,3-dioxygenase-like lactoylglutathione lyase family enzyme
MIRSLQYFALAVPDLEVGRKFYTDFGMEAGDDGDRVVLRCAGRDQDQIVLLDGVERKRLHHICFGTRENEIEGMKQRLETEGFELVDPPYEGARDGVWFHDTDDLLVCLCVAEEAPARPESEMQFNARGFHRRLNERGCFEIPYVARPRRLGHMLLFTANLKAKVDLYTNILGMRLSDTMGGDVVAFLRNGNGGDHHVIALARSEKPGFHHASFEFGTVDDIGVAAANMTAKGYKHCWGFGRHVVGSNYFHYFRDPWGSIVEHFADIDIIGEDQDWQVKDWPLKGNFARWVSDGPLPDDFLFNSDA